MSNAPGAGGRSALLWPTPEAGEVQGTTQPIPEAKGGSNFQYEHLRRPSAKSRPLHCFSLRPRGAAEKQWQSVAAQIRAELQGQFLQPAKQLPPAWRNAARVLNTFRSALERARNSKIVSAWQETRLAQRLGAHFLKRRFSQTPVSEQFSVHWWSRVGLSRKSSNQMFGLSRQLFSAKILSSFSPCLGCTASMRRSVFSSHSRRSFLTTL